MFKEAEKQGSRAEGQQRRRLRRRSTAAKPQAVSALSAVSIGDGNCRDFQGHLGVDYLIEGGQTMNPSTEDMLNAIDKGERRYDFYSPEQ